MKTTFTLKYKGKQGKIIEQDGIYSVCLFLNHGETILSRYSGKYWKNYKTAEKKLFDFIFEK